MQSSQQSIINAFNSQTYVKSQMDVQHTPLYDTVTIAAAGSVNNNTASWFTSVGGKTLAQTNLGSNKELQAPEAFSIFSIRLKWNENIAYADLTSIVQGFALNFKIGNKSYNLAPIWHYNQGGGIYGSGNLQSTAGLALAQITNWTNGYPSREGMHKLAIPIVIENKAQFFAYFEGTPFSLSGGGTGFISTLLLDGLYARGVQ